MNKKYLKDTSTGTTGSIEVKRDGTAILRTCTCNGYRKKSTHKNENSAKQAWYRYIR